MLALVRIGWGRPGGVVDAADIGLWVPKRDAAQPMVDSRRKCDVNAMFGLLKVDGTPKRVSFNDDMHI